MKSLIFQNNNTNPLRPITEKARKKDIWTNPKEVTKKKKYWGESERVREGEKGAPFEVCAKVEELYISRRVFELLFSLSLELLGFLRWERKRGLFDWNRTAESDMRVHGEQWGVAQNRRSWGVGFHFRALNYVLGFVCESNACQRVTIHEETSIWRGIVAGFNGYIPDTDIF